MQPRQRQQRGGVVGSHLQHLLQRLRGGVGGVELLVPDVGDRHPQRQLVRLAARGGLDLGVLGEHVDQVVPALVGAQDPLQLAVGQRVALVDVQDLAQVADRLLDVVRSCCSALLASLRSTGTCSAPDVADRRRMSTSCSVPQSSRRSSIASSADSTFGVLGRASSASR